MAKPSKHLRVRVRPGVGISLIVAGQRLNTDPVVFAVDDVGMAEVNRHAGMLMIEHLPGKIKADTEVKAEAEAAAESVADAATDSADFIRTIAKAIGDFPPGDPDFWTVSGKPEVRRLAEVIGRPVSGAQRDAAFALVHDGRA